MESQKRLVAIRMEHSLVKKLDQISKYEDLNRSSLIRRISRRYIRNFESKNEIGNDGFFEGMNGLVGK